MSVSIIPVNAGTTLTFEMRWKEQNGDPTDLTGSVLDAVQVHASLAGKLTFTLSDAAGGIVQVRLDGADPLPRGDYTWRARRTPVGGDEITTGLLAFRVA